MALKTQPVVEDVGSELYEHLRTQFNLLLDTIDGLANGASGSDLRDAVRTAGIYKIDVTKHRPRNRKFPLK